MANQAALSALLSMPYPERAAAEIVFFNLKPDLLITVSVLFIVLVSICIALRVYVRGFMIRAFGMDDWLLIFAYIVFLVNSSLDITIALIQKAEGLIKPVERMVTLALASMMAYLADQIFIKITLAYFFLRVVKDRWQKWTLKGAVYIYAAFTAAFIFVAIFQCGLPTAHNLLYGKCLSWPKLMGPLNYTAAALNAVVDWILTLVPIYVVIQVDMSRKEKISVALLMMLGLLGSIVSVIRIPYVRGVAHTPDFSFFWKVIPITLSSLAENGIGIMAICLAALRPLYARIFETARSKFSANSGNNSGRAGQKISGGYAVNSANNDQDVTGSYGRQSVAPARNLDPTGKFTLQNYSRPAYKSDYPTNPRAYTDMEKGYKEDHRDSYYGERGPPMVLTMLDDGDDGFSDEFRSGRRTPSATSTLFPIQKNG